MGKAAEDRRYVLRRLEADGRERYISVDEFSRTSYSCGAIAGELLELSEPLEILDEHGVSTGVQHKAGEVWAVLEGSHQDPDVLWLRQADGELHSWADDESLWHQFARVSGPAT